MATIARTELIKSFLVNPVVYCIVANWTCVVVDAELNALEYEKRNLDRVHKSITWAEGSKDP